MKSSESDRLRFIILEHIKKTDPKDQPPDNDHDVDSAVLNLASLETGTVASRASRGAEVEAGYEV